MRMLSRETFIPKGAVTPKNPFTVTLMKPKMIVRRSHSIGQYHSCSLFRHQFSAQWQCVPYLVSSILEKDIFVRDKSLQVGGKIITNFCLTKTHGNN